MLKIEKKDWITLAILALFVFTGLALFWGKQGHIIIDIGREYFISEQVMNGEVLYKDIFNIYGPLAYQMNAILFKIFGSRVATLYIFGNAAAALLIFCIYALSRQFLERKFSFFIALYSAFIGIYKGLIFNYVMPYSSAVVYGMIAVCLSLIFLARYTKIGNIKNFYISLIFAGASVAFKYDFLPYLLIFPYIAFFVKKISFREVYIAVVCALIVPVLSFSNLVVLGLSFRDIIYNYELFKRIAQAPSLIYFYKSTGIYFNGNYVFQNVVHTICGIILAFASWFVLKLLKKIPNKFVSALIGAGLFFLFLSVSAHLQMSYRVTFLPALVLLLLLIKFKSVYKNPPEFIFVCSALLISFKSLMYLAVSIYGIYYVPFLLTALMILLKNYYIKDESNLKTIFAVWVLIIALPAVSYEINKAFSLKYRIGTEKGDIPAASGEQSSKLLIKKILETTDKDDKIVILPEGQFINYLTGRKTDSFYNNLVPMYVEAFGEEAIIDNYSKNMPEYFVINDRDTSQYGKSTMCIDYAQNLCVWIFKNYHVTYKIVGEPQFTILRKNK